ncbi:MAG: nucleotide exchange factor GrpE [Methanoregula sp.]|jgi:molecular chaperone GrpE
MEDPATTDLKKRADLFESQYNKLKKEFKDYIETSRKNEDTKKKELQADTAKKMLVFADSLTRMSGAATGAPTCDLVNSTNENFQKNIDVMYKQLLSVSGLTPVDPAPGDRFDDSLHMAIGLEYGSRYPEDTVYRVIRKGYLREKTLIRPAEVIISKRPREEIKAQERGIWTSIVRRLFPAHPQISLLDQQVDALEHARSETTVRLEGEIVTVNQSVAQLMADKQETDKRLQELEDATGRCEEEIENVREEIPKSFAKKRDVDQFIREQADAITHLTAEVGYLQDYLSQSVATKQDVDEIIQEQTEMIEHLNAEVESLKGFIAQSVPEQSRWGLTDAEDPCAAPVPAGMSQEPVTALREEDESLLVLEPEEALLEPVTDDHAGLPFSGTPVPENPDDLPEPVSHEIPEQPETEPSVGEHAATPPETGGEHPPRENPYDLPEPASREIPGQPDPEPSVGEHAATPPETGGEHPPWENPVPDEDIHESKVLNTEPGNI